MCEEISQFFTHQARRGAGYDTAHPRLVNIRAVIHPNTAQTSGTPTTNSSGVWVKLTPVELVLSSTKAKVDCRRT